jgi:polyisoprenoid-binding protein YceI
MAGTIAPDGQAKIVLMLDSVETLIPIRDERMREFLFDTADYKEAVLTAKIDPERIKSMAVGEIAEITAEGVLALHGQTQPMVLVVQAAKVSANTVMVASVKPLVIDAAKFGMSDGVEKLRELAGLAAISNAVPVNFVLTFVDGGT